VAVLVSSMREEFRNRVERIEQGSGKGRTKWIKTRRVARRAFWQQYVNHVSPTFGVIWVGRLRGSREYTPFVIATTAQAIFETT
jgi:hypothetical protein